jgi:hypothetical protein
MKTHPDADRMLGKNVYDLEGQKVGTAASLYLSDASGAPEWATVKTGLFGSKELFVPLAGARTDEDGLHLRARKDLIKDAPHFEDDGHLSEQEVMDLHRHYGLDSGTTPQGTTPQGRNPGAGDNRGGQAGAVGPAVRRAPAGRHGDRRVRPGPAAQVRRHRGTADHRAGQARRSPRDA